MVAGRISSEEIWLLAMSKGVRKLAPETGALRGRGWAANAGWLRNAGALHGEGVVELGFAGFATAEGIGRIVSGKGFGGHLPS